MIQLHGQIETMETQHQQLNTEIETANTQLDEVQNHRQAALEDLQTAQEQLVQAEKLSTMGQMVAGIVHEDHQGSLIVEDSKLGGACFKVWFPLEP